MNKWFGDLQPLTRRAKRSLIAMWILSCLMTWFFAELAIGVADLDNHFSTYSIIEAVRRSLQGAIFFTIVDGARLRQTFHFLTGDKNNEDFRT